MQFREIWRTWGRPVVLAVLVSGCGGGGGGTGGGDAPTGGGNPDAGYEPSGLVPSSPSLGAVLHADAATLRPLRDRATYVYRGRYFGAWALPDYTNTLVQVASGSEYTEPQSNAYGDGEDAGFPVRVEGGAVRQRVSLPLGDGLPTLEFDFVEMRSPVRTGDRVVSVDRRIDDIGADLDGDHVNDRLDVAMWSQVIGPQTVALFVGRRVDAVRVDTTAVLRVRYSATQQFGETARVVQSTWYAPGLGVVRSMSYEPDGDPHAEELLDTLDAVDHGIGHTATAYPTVPEGSELAGQAMPPPLAAVAFDDGHAVALSGAPGLSSGAGFALTQIDARGQIVAAQVYRAADVHPEGALLSTDLHLVRFGDGVAVVFKVGGRVALLRLDATGQHAATARATYVADAPAALGAIDSTFDVAGDGENLWLTWIDAVVDDDAYLPATYWARRIGADGSADPPVVLARDVDPRGWFGLQTPEAAGGQLFLRWTEGGFVDPDMKFAVVGAGHGDTLATGLLARGGDGGCEGMRSHATGAGRLLLSCTPSGAAPQTVALDASLHPIMVDGALARMEAMPGDRGYEFHDASLSTMPGGLLARMQATGSVWPDGAGNTATFTVLAELPWGGAAVDRAAVRLLTRQSSGGGLEGALLTLPLADRVLVLAAGRPDGVGPSRLATMVAWR